MGYGVMPEWGLQSEAVTSVTFIDLDEFDFGSFGGADQPGDYDGLLDLANTDDGIRFLPHPDFPLYPPFRTVPAGIGDPFPSFEAGDFPCIDPHL